MTQVMSVSANAAAFVMEALKPPLRKGVKATVDENAQTARRQDPESNTESILPPSESIAGISARLGMLDNSHYRQQTTLIQAVDAYRRAGG